MKKAIIALVLLIFLCSGVYAYLSSEGARRFISEENHFLSTGEIPESNPSMPVKMLGDDYWVTSILSGETLVGIVCVKDAENPEIVYDSGANRKLFRTVLVYRKFEETKANLSKQNQWLYGQENFFRSFSNFLEQEKNDLSIISSEVSESDVRTQLSAVSSKLLLLISLTDDVRAMIAEASSYEKEFFVSPETGKTDVFVDYFDLKDEPGNLYSKVLGLFEEAVKYDSEVKKLQNFISKADMDPGLKSQLIAFSNPPNQLFALDSYSQMASNNKLSFEGVFPKIDAQVNDLLSQFESRAKFNEAWLGLYGENELISKETKNSQLTTLETAYKYAVSEKVRGYWIKKSELDKLEKNYSEAVKSFDSGNYESAVVFLQNARDAAIKLYRGGQKEPVIEEPKINQDLMNIAIALIVVLVLLFLYSKREAIRGYFDKGREEDDDDQVYLE